jgi:hypothetical protein
MLLNYDMIKKVKTRKAELEEKLLTGSISRIWRHRSTNVLCRMRKKWRQGIFVPKNQDKFIGNESYL